MASAYTGPEFISDWIDRTPSSVVDGAVMKHRALTMWPGLDRARLASTHGDPKRIARLVEKRSGLLFDEILGLLVGESQVPDEADD